MTIKTYFARFSIHKLLVALVFIAIFTMAVRVPADTDTWWHLRSGQYILENRTVPTVDPFSHTRAGHFWIDHGWLAQIFWYGVYATGDWALVALALAGLVTVAFWLMWRQIEGNLFVGALSMILGAIVSSVVWAARPQMITFVFTALIAYWLDRFKRRQGHLWWVPLLMVVWVNVHGGFAIGFMLMLAYLIGEAVNNLTRHEADPVADWSRLRHLGLIFVISLAVIVVNPYTWRMWLYPFQTVGIGALRDFIQEWQSPNFHLPHTQPFIIMLLLVLGAMGRAARRTDWTDLALIALWSGWGLYAARNIAIFGLIATPILARYANLVWADQWQRWGYSRPPFAAVSPRRPRTRLNLLLLTLVLIAAIIKISVPVGDRANLVAERANLPYEAVQFVRQAQPPGPIFNSYNWGGYLIFKLWPDYPVYIDGRTDLYDDAFIRRYLKATLAREGWQQILDEDGINLVFIESNGILARFLRQEPGWREIHRDKQAAVFVRREASH